MSDEKPNPWAELFATLIPTDTITLKDLTGAEHTALTVLCAADEFRVTDKLSEVTDLAASPGVSAALQTVMSGRASPPELFGLARMMLREPRVLGIVADAFAIAYPDEFEAALENVRKHPKLSKRLPANPTAAHLFPIEGLLGGILPLAGNVGAGIRNRMQSLRAPTT